MSGSPSAETRMRLALATLPGALVVGLVLAQALPAAADIMPTARRTTWNPGIPGGIPVRTTVCATVNASTYGNGTQDATAGIQAAINACPVGQVVQLSAGDFLVNGTHPIAINKGIVVRGAGASATKLRKTSTAANPLFVIGERWLTEAGSANLTANAAKGATSVQVTSAAGFSVGQLVVLDEITDNSFVYWGINPAAQPGGQARGWFTRYDRPVGQMLEVASISGNTISFTTPLHISFRTAQTAQLTRYTIPYGAKHAGLEDLYVRGGRDDNVTMRFALYSWIKGVESDWSRGDSFALDSCFRCVLRDSYAHDTPAPFPGGDGYMLSLSRYTADSLVENNIFINGNKVMVMRASGGGNVIGYNYFDNGIIQNSLGWMETGLNASHMACPHFELFEGNQAFNIDGDDTWGGAVYNTFFRNHATGKRRSYDDLGNRRAIGLMYGHYEYSFVGNVLGTANQDPFPYSGFAYEDLFPWGDDPIGMWRLGYTPENWNAPPQPRVVTSTHRHANWDYATDSVHWAAGYDTTLPSSLYLSARPAFFGNNPWPWVDATGTTKLHVLPARARYDAGNPNPSTQILTVVKVGNGTVTSSPAGIDCGGTCLASYPQGTVVTLTAAPAAGSTFAGWSGACTGTGTCQVTLNAPAAVTATFTLGPISHTLTVNKTGTGAGTVSSSPAGINCGATCSASYLAGTGVTLTAAASSGSTFTGWSGACTGTGSCQVTMSAAASVTAAFTLNPASHLLTVARAGAGHGSVTSSPTGINCGASCSASYSTGTVVTLAALAAGGSAFTGWSGGCTGAGACQVTINAATSVTATFALRPRGDFNADNRPDLVWRHDFSGQNVVWFMNGVNLVSGTFTNPTTLADNRWTIVGTNDFNQDGRMDLLWRHGFSGENVVWFLNGVDLIAGTFTTPSALVDVRWQMVGTGDFNLDAHPDILWRHDFSGQNVLWYMNGTVLTSGTFTTPPALADVNWKMAGVSDFDLDGRQDILWHHRVSGQVVLWYMNGSVMVNGTFTTPNGLADTSWRVVAVGDYNADGRPDLVWRHQVTGQIAVWFMDNATLASGTFTNPASFPDVNWKLVGPR
jgi:hypothetical protein